jgi:hypothetical protein
MKTVAYKMNHLMNNQKCELYLKNDIITIDVNEREHLLFLIVFP